MDIFKKKLIEKLARSKRKLVVVIDKDGVLCNPHEPIQPIAEIIDIVKAGGIVVIISGAAIDRAEKEVIQPLLNFVGEDTTWLNNIYLIVNNGAGIYHFKNGYKCIFRKDIAEEIGAGGVAKIINILEETRRKFLEIFNIQKQYPQIQQINNEEIQITFRILGKMNNDELRKTFDPQGEKRQVWAAYIRKRLAEEGIAMDVSVDGTSSINILVPGINKGSGIAHLINLLSIDNDTLIYLGDNFYGKRNDRLAVEDIIDLALNFGKDIADEIPGTTILNIPEKGVAGARKYLRIIHEVLTNK